MAKLKHGHASRVAYNGGFSPTYYSWMNMKKRCNDKLDKNYGGKGIAVCKRWQDFVNFLSDMRERPIGTTLDRIDSNDNYKPSNCRWSTSKVQGQNRSTVTLKEGEVWLIKKLLSDWYISRSRDRTQAIIGNMFNQTQDAISRIYRQRRWR